MEIRFNTDKHIQGSQSLVEKYSPSLEKMLQKYAEYISKVEVFMADENGQKSGVDDKRCTIEVHINGKPSAAVTDYSDTLAKAMANAKDKLSNLLEHKLGPWKTH